MPTRDLKLLICAAALTCAFAAFWLLRGAAPVDAGDAPTLDRAATTVSDSGAPSPASPIAASFAAHAPPIVDEGADDPEIPDRWTDAAIPPLDVFVVDMEDRPLVGVPVVVVALRDGGVLAAGPRVTKRDGRARFPIDLALEREGELLVAARAIPGRAAFTNVSVAIDRATEVRLRVHPGATARVRLFEPDGALASGGRVRKALLGEPAPETGDRGAELTAAFRETTPRSFREGSDHLLHGLVAGETAPLLATHVGFETTLSQVVVPDPAPAQFGVDLRLGSRLSGVAFEVAAPDVVSERPFTFGCRPADGGEVLAAAGVDSAPTQKSPKFRRDVPPGRATRLRVEAFRDGVLAAAFDVDVPALFPGEVFDAGIVKLEVVVVAASGVVVDADGAPLQGAVVECTSRAGVGFSSTTDAHGRFVIHGMRGAGPYQVAIHANGRVSHVASDVDEGATPLRVALELAGGVEGRLHVPEGVDVSGLRVRAFRGGRAPVATTPSADGTFRLLGLGAGVYVVVVDGPGIESLRITDVVVQPPEVARDERLLHLAPAASSAGGMP